jgi:hypothetical protein
MTFKETLKRGISCDSVTDASTVTKKAVCLFAHPGRMALFPLAHWYERRYRGRYKFARLTFVFDLLLVGFALGLGSIALALALYHPLSFADKITFEASVAPNEIVSGASSTLVIHYENGTGKELRDARLSLEFPAHFLLEGIESDIGSANDRTVTLGTIPVDGFGSVKIRGVMFGDVGGEQTFQSTLSFTHGEKNVAGSKTDQYAFTPTRSTLVLSLSLPERMIAAHRMVGILSYENTGQTDFPKIVISPEWPSGFVLESSDVPLMDGAFHLPIVTAESKGTMRFSGILGDTEGTTAFAFHPSIAFGADQYKQETLSAEATVLPIPLRISHSVDADTVRPGGSARVTVTYENIGDEALIDVRLAVESQSPFARFETVTISTKDDPRLASVEPRTSGTAVIEVPLLAAIGQTATNVYENVPFMTWASGTFDADGMKDVVVMDDELSCLMTSPLALDAFARYAAPSGDQIGRGPLPPSVGESTKYWVFWNLRNTTNSLSNVRVEGELGEHVSFTGRQTVSTGNGVTFDFDSNQIVWTADTISPTFSPSSKVVGIAFEVAITPDDAQTGTIPTLLKNIRVTATDAATGAFVSASGATVTTDLPNDALAAGKAAVQ